MILRLLTQISCITNSNHSSFFLFFWIENAGWLEPWLRDQAIEAAMRVTSVRVRITAHVWNDPIFGAVIVDAARVAMFLVLENILLSTLLKSLDPWCLDVIVKLPFLRVRTILSSFACLCLTIWISLIWDFQRQFLDVSHIELLETIIVFFLSLTELLRGQWHHDVRIGLLCKFLHDLELDIDNLNDPVIDHMIVELKLLV